MKLALYLSDNAAKAQRVVSAMIEAQRHEIGCISRLVPFPLGCLGLLGRPDESSTGLSICEGPDGSFLAFSGLPISANGGEQRAVVGPKHSLMRDAAGGSARAETIARLRTMDGAFVAIWWDARTSELTLVTDFLGMQPMYRADTDGATVFASEVKAFACSGLLPPEPDAGAWGAMLCFGHQIGPRTLLSGVTRMPAATEIRFTPTRGDVRTQSWSWPASRGVRNTVAFRDAIGEAVRDDVAAYASAFPRASILLSGGFDSRLILCLCREIGLRPPAVVQSHPDENADADARFATAFAKLAGVPYRRVSVGEAFFGSDDYLRFLERNEIATPSYRLFIATVASVIAPERHGIWEGLLLDPALKFDYGEGGFKYYLEARSRRGYRGAIERLFAPRWAEQILAEYDALLAAEQSCYSDDAEGVWRFSVLNRSRFRTGVNPYQVYDAVTPPLTPGMSKRFWEVVASADPRARFGKQLYRAVFDHLAPDGLRLPVASGSSLIPGHGRARLYHTQRARAAVQSIAQRPRVHRALRSLGFRTGFAWQPTRFLDVALSEVQLDDTRLNADWIRRAGAEQAEGTMAEEDQLALETLMYWQAWHHTMQGDLLSAWASNKAH